MLFSSFSESPRELAPVMPIKPISRRRFFTALAGGSTLALLGGLTLKNIWPAFISKLTAQSLGIEDSIYMAWSHDLNKVAVTPFDDTSATFLWNYEQQRVFGTLRPFGHKQISSSGLAWSPDGRQLLQIANGPGQNQTTSVICWDVQAQQKIYTTLSKSGISDPWKIRWSPDGQQIAIIGSGQLVVINANDGQEIFSQEFSNEETADLSWSSTSDRLALLLGNNSSKEISLLIWDTHTRQLGDHLPQSDAQYDTFDSAMALTWLTEASIAIVARKKFWLISLQDGANLPLATFNGGFGGLNNYLLARSPDNSRLMVNDNGNLAIWNIQELKVERKIFLGYQPPFIQTLSWITNSQIAMIESLSTRVVLDL